MSRKSPAPKSPAPKSKPSRAPAPNAKGTPQQRVEFLLNYITLINRHTLAAIHQLYAAPDCQVAQVPALLHFDHFYADSNFRATAFLTSPQEAVLKIAAEESIEALMAKAFEVGKALFKGVVAAEQDLVAALTTPPAPVSKIPPLPVKAAAQAVMPAFDDPPPDPPPPQTGCCYYVNGGCQPDVPRGLCEGDPDYSNWVGGSPCVM